MSQHGQELLGNVLSGTLAKKRLLLPDLLKLKGTMSENITSYVAGEIPPTGQTLLQKPLENPAEHKNNHVPRNFTNWKQRSYFHSPEGLFFSIRTFDLKQKLEVIWLHIFGFDREGTSLCQWVPLVLNLCGPVNPIKVL